MQDTVAGYRMRERLVERLGSTRQRRYLLTVEQAQTATAATITSDGDTTRFNLVGTAQYTLADINGETVLSGDVETFTGYSATGSTVATQAAEIDASKRLSIALADLIVARLLLNSRELSE
jgi:LPS-assembly lipoprotein